MIRLGLWVWGTKTTEVKCHSHRITLKAQAIDMIYHCDVDLDHLAKTVSVQSLHRKINLPPTPPHFSHYTP